MIKNKIASLLIICILVLFTACSSTKQNNINNSLPSWYLNTPSNTTSTLYGTGEAYSLDEAKTNALSNMSQKLIVSVDSSINTTTQTSVNTYSKDIKKKINLKTKKLSFTNYKVSKAIQSGASFIVLLKVNRIELFKQKKKELDLLDTKIQSNINNLQNNSKLEKIYNLINLSPSINDAKELSFVLYSINNDFDYSKYYTKYDKYLNKINLLKSNLRIKITSNTNNTLYKQYLKELFTNNNYKVISTNEDILIKISNNIRYSKARGWQIVKASTTLNIISNNKTVSTKTISSIGRSSSTKQNALSSSAVVFKNKVQKIGLNRILFNK